MNSKIFELAGRLNGINAFFEQVMKVSIRNYEAAVVQGYREAFNIPSVFPCARHRVALRNKCSALIIMDRAQIALAEQCASDRQSVRQDAIEALARKRKEAQVEKSAWFGGEYDERTYY